MSLLSRDEIITLLEELGADLDRICIRAELFLVGGGAMALAYTTGLLTQHLDKVFESKTIVYDAARAVAERRGHMPNWLNDAVKELLPGEDPNASTVLERPGIAVRVALPHHLFAMKAVAAHVERDAADLMTLYRLCGFMSIEEALDCVQSFYPDHLIPPKTPFLLRELLE